MKKIFLLLASVFFSTMMFAQVLLWKDGEVIYSKNIDEVDKISFYEVEDFELVNDEIVLELYRDWYSKYKWIYAEFTPKKSYGILQYTSSDENVVTVSYDGRLVARGIGEAIVTVKLIGTELEKKCKVKVVGFSGTFGFNFDDKNVVLGNISDNDLLLKNLEENCIPSNVKNMTVIDYEVFLQERRNMMAKLIEKYYKGL